MNMRDLIPWGGSNLAAGRGDVGNPVWSLHREMNRLFDDFHRGFTGAAGGLGWPHMDVAETETEYRVTAELPGLEEKEVEVTLNGSVLTLKGEKEVEQESGNRAVSERYYGRFQRSIELGDDIDRDNVSASMKNGLLSVVLPKRPDASAAAKRIEIKPH